MRKERAGGLFESRPWYVKLKIGGVLSIQVELQITSRVRLVVLYYINFTTGADLMISVNSVESGSSIDVFQGKTNL